MCWFSILQNLGSKYSSVINDGFEVVQSVAHSNWEKEWNGLDFLNTRQGRAIPNQLCLKLKVVYNKKFACRFGSTLCNCANNNYDCNQNAADVKSKAIAIVDKVKNIYSTLPGLGTTISITYEGKIFFPYLF